MRSSRNALVGSACAPMESARRGGLTADELRFVAERRPRASWSALARMLGRSEPDIRMACDPDYGGAAGMRAPLARDKREPTAAEAALDRIEAELQRLHGRATPAQLAVAEALVKGLDNSRNVANRLAVTDAVACMRLNRLLQDGIAVRSLDNGLRSYRWALAPKWAVRS